MEAFDLSHVKVSTSERSHVITFIMNKMGKLTCKVASARLERVQKAIDKRNRLMEGVKCQRRSESRAYNVSVLWPGDSLVVYDHLGRGE